MEYNEVMQVIGELTAETTALLKDVKEQKKVEVELTRAYMELYQIFNSAMDGMRVIDRDYNILRVNDAMCHISGCSREDFEGKKCFEEFCNEKCLTPDCTMVRIQKGEEKVEFEMVKMGQSGQKKTYHVKSTPYWGPQGELAGILEIYKDITDRKRYEERLSYLAYHDNLTGLANRTYFMDRLRLELARAKRNGLMLAVVYLDLDGFKQINDSMGHAIGDKLLKYVAERLTRSVRVTDTVARMGGDEFTLLLTELKRPRDAATLVKKLSGIFKIPWRNEGMEYDFRASIGISLYPGDGEDPHMLMERADKAMYRSKKQGFNFQFYNFFLNEF